MKCVKWQFNHMALSMRCMRGPVAGNIFEDAPDPRYCRCRLLRRRIGRQLVAPPAGGPRHIVLIERGTAIGRGLDYALARSVDPLFQSLRAAAMMAEDPLNLGLRTAENGACVSAGGAASRHLAASA